MHGHRYSQLQLSIYSPRIVHFCAAILGPAALLLLVQDALVEVAHDHPGEPFVMDEEALADRVGVLFGDVERLLQDLVGAKAAVDEPLDTADPVLDDLP